MRVRISDGKALREISPHSLAAYVKSQGWYPAEEYGDSSLVFEKSGFPEIIVPKTSEIGDYEYSVSQVIAALSKIEDRGELQVFNDLITSDKDVIRLTAQGEGHSGTIAVTDGLGFLQNSFNLLQAAACSAIDPKPYFHAGKYRRASSYMQKVEMGQTERGSFVVNLLAPVPPALHLDQGNIWDEIYSEPFERAVTFTFVNALRSAKEAAFDTVNSSKLENFYQKVPRGISANLCSALADLIEYGRNLKISLTWARTRPLERERPSFEFGRSEGELFREVARAFLEREPQFDQTFTAFVVRLKREAAEERGHIGLQLFGGETPVAATADVSDRLYRAAIFAHEHKRLVQISGDLKKKGQRWHFEPLHDITVLKDLFDDWDGDAHP